MRLAGVNRLRLQLRLAATEPLRWHLRPRLRQQRRCSCRCTPAIMAVAAAEQAHGHGGYDTLAEPHSSQLVVKASKFLTTAWPVNSREEVCRGAAEHF